MRTKKLVLTFLTIELLVFLALILLWRLSFEQNKDINPPEFSFTECLPDTLSTIWTSTEIDDFDYNFKLTLDSNKYFSLEELALATNENRVLDGKWYGNDERKSVKLIFNELDDRWARILNEDLSLYNCVLSYDLEQKYIEIQVQYFVGDQVEEICKDERYYINIFGARLYRADSQ